MKNKYYLGFDIGTDSVGYAVTSADANYSIPRFKGKKMWGVTLFEAANLKEERRNFRTARRRIDRKQQRIKLTQELFAPEIAKVDINFFRRISESALLREDRHEPYGIFNDIDFSDKEYNKKYPTIHHLICELITSYEPHDVRLVYLACAWLVGHRGHFLSELSDENIASALDFSVVYNNLISYFENLPLEEEYAAPWHLDNDGINNLADILKAKKSITDKRNQVANLLFDGKKPSKEITGSFPFSTEAIIRLMCGGEVKLKDLYGKEEYADLPSFKLAKSDEDYDGVLRELGDDGELLLKLKAIYDWSILCDLLGSEQYISKKKIAVYEQHKTDLKFLKDFIRKYLPKEYKNVFKKQDSTENYCAYSGNGISKNITKEVFSEYLRKLIDKVEVEDEDLEKYEDMKLRLNKDVLTFLPKQVDGDNRVIPYQLYYIELKKILESASVYLPFLNETDADGYTVKAKLLSIMKFRIPYYVGPLNSREFGWIKCKGEGKIYPWNFDKIVDLDKSEQAFINKMTNTCSYLPEENVLPKKSLLYEKFEVLNEINNLKVNGIPISVEAKQSIYENLFLTRKKVTLKQIKTLLLRYYDESELATVSGIDENIKSSLGSHISFQRLLGSKALTESEVEDIIVHGTYCEEKMRFKRFLDTRYEKLPDNDRKYVSSLSFKDFGRLSRKLLTELEGTDTETGETGTVMYFMWNVNLNLSELLLSDKFTFKTEIETLNREYYSVHPQTLIDRLDSMYVSNAVKRPIIRTLDITNDIVKAMGCAPKKIFIEMARGEEPDKKGKRTKTRKDQLLELYEKIKTDSDVKQLITELNAMGSEADNKLQSESLFLYYLQLGKSMYSGKPLDLEHINYNVDHIYPQSKVVDDSLLNNKVLVLSSENGDKGDKYPIDASIREKMTGYWQYLRQNNLITEEKFKRLIRSTPFSNDEKWGFINRQLVETRQSTKVVATLLQEKYPDTEIVYVKAGLVSEFRHDNNILKCRSLNDLHHAKDAYLNIVCGNVYHEHFTKKWFLDHKDTYNIKQNKFMEQQIKAGDNLIWDGWKSKETVIKNVSGNQINMTMYSFCRHGGFFDQNPVSAAEGLIPRKANLPTEKYGGYQRPTVTFFILTKYTAGKKQELMLVPVELLYAEKFLASVDFAKKYIAGRITQISNKQADSLEFPFGLRPIKINTVFSFDGFLCTLSGVSSGGKCVIMAPFMPLILSGEDELYLKKIESFAKKYADNNSYAINEKYDGIKKDLNVDIYKKLTDKHRNSVFSKRPNSPAEVIGKGFDMFEKLSVEKQALAIMNILETFGRKSSGCDLTSVGGKGRSAATVSVSSSLSNWKKQYSEVVIIDKSSSGLWKKKSQNLLELI